MYRMSKPDEEEINRMTMTDPVADLLTRLRNANSAHHETVSLPSSKLKSHIAEILKREGFIESWKVEDARVGQTLTIDLKYGPDRQRSIVGIKRVSKPGLRVYAKSTEIPQVFGGLGVAILSTSSGLLTDREAEKKGVGGEVLAYVW
ncbi:SSU ribosomal protein S8P [Frigoribacterium sp. PhB116]|nr:SSU ribosomal protein S8P [Frigoribacterium sp. PhB107]TDT63989.1 SSU ribosomal protein S8P [Frigoribacterium sp. PhB116]